MLELAGVSKRYGRFKAVDDVSFRVGQNEVVALLGPNGAGKSTILKCITGLVAFSGRIAVDGRDARREGVSVRKRVAYLPQQVSLYSHMSVGENLRFFAGVKKLGIDQVDKSLTDHGLHTYVKKRVSELSEGLRQKLMLATTLLGDSPVFLFDEPTANLDIRGVIAFKELVDSLARRGKTIILSTHLLSDVNEIADRVIVMNRGKVVADGSVEEIMGEGELNTRILITLNEQLAEESVGSVEGRLKKSGAKTVSFEGEFITVSVDTSGKIAVLKAIEEIGLTMKDFRIFDPSLEDAFLRITSSDEGYRGEHH